MSRGVEGNKGSVETPTFIDATQSTRGNTHEYAREEEVVVMVVMAVMAVVVQANDTI